MALSGHADILEHAVRYKRVTINAIMMAIVAHADGLVGVVVFGEQLGRVENHIRRRLRKGRCGASLLRFGTLELATQKPWLFTATSHCSRVT
jgi:hypothetical protein